MTTRVVYKYGPFSLSVHGRPVQYWGTPVMVDLQDGQAYMWCLLENVIAHRLGVMPCRYARIAATGEEFEGTYFGSVATPEGFVWHVVEAA